jgi:hypothetical protein
VDHNWNRHSVEHENAYHLDFDILAVVIFLQCTHTQFKQFLFRLKSNTPALATITKIKTKDFLGTGFFIKYHLVLLHMLFQHFVKFFSIEFNRRLSALLVVFL